MIDSYNKSLWYKSNGIPSFPISHKGKQPVVKWSTYRNKLQDDSVLDGWFRRTVYNIGIICGNCVDSDKSLVVFDFDNMVKYYEYKSTCKNYLDDAINKTFKVITNRGIHVYFLSRNDEASRKNKEYCVDIQGIGKYVVTAPSIHPSGKAYKEKGNIIFTIDTSTDFFEKEVIMYKRPEQIISKTSWVNKLLDIDDSESKVSKIKRCLPILDFCSKYSAPMPKSADGRWFMSRCINPLHRDLNPSFSIDTQNNVGKCLGHCNLNDRWNDVIGLYAIMNGISNADAIKELITKI